jgi:hypothetical protein
LQVSKIEKHVCFLSLQGSKSEKHVCFCFCKAAEQSIDFLVSDIQRFTELTSKLMETKINSISQIQFGHSKADSLFREGKLAGL